jgi:asparagine synthase (glutamine-hydrolysing)
MCGIAGELRLTSGERGSAERVRAMCDVMVHRGPDSFGEFANGEVALGMRRLSIVDVAGGTQPLGNEDGTIQVVCNGEISRAADAGVRPVHHLKTLDVE